jgi:tRNA threonylcarbamoyl adenosine modification protein YeaZ
MILAIRTDTERAELYLLDVNGKVLGSKKWLADRKLSKQLLVEVQKLVNSVTKRDLVGHPSEIQASHSRRNKTPASSLLKNLTGIIVFTGPGSFTGLRIGISVANALAFGLGISVVGSSGQEWIKNGAMQITKTPTGKFVMPVYGAKPHITKQKK